MQTTTIAISGGDGISDKRSNLGCMKDQAGGFVVVVVGTRGK